MCNTNCTPIQIKAGRGAFPVRQLPDFDGTWGNVATLQRISPFDPIVGEFLCETGPGLVQ